jgi:hypothetical protein
LHPFSPLVVFHIVRYLTAPVSTFTQDPTPDLQNYQFKSQDEGFIERAQQIQTRLHNTPYTFAHSQQAQSIGYVSLQEADLQDLAGDIEAREELMILAASMADFMVDLNPASGFGKSVYELATGTNLFSGQELNTFEYGMAAFGVLSLGFSTAAKASHQGWC